MKYNTEFLSKIAIFQMNSKIGDIQHNLNSIEKAYSHHRNKAKLIITPELSVIGYPPEDLLFSPDLPERIDTAITSLKSMTSGSKTGLLIGLPIYKNGHIYNVAILLANGQEVGRIYKHHLPNYGVFDEKRYFTPCELDSIKSIQFQGINLGIMICEDMWHKDVPAKLALQHPEIFIVINASPYDTEKHAKRLKLASNIVKKHNIPLIYANMVGGKDELLFDGQSFAILPNQTQSSINLNITLPAWKEACTMLEGSSTNTSDKIAEIYYGLILSIKDYLKKHRFEKILLGLSGGIDSALVAALCCDALGPSNVRAVMLPSQFTSRSSIEDAQSLAQNLQCHYETCDIQAIYELYLSQLKPHMKTFEAQNSVTKENLQSRIRGNILMAFSNEYNELLITTGNKSEYAVGYCTIYGDMCGGFAPLKDIYKTLVYELAKWRNTHIPDDALCNAANPIPQSILTKAPTAELKENQKDQDTLPPYEILDNVLMHLIEKTYSYQDLLARNIKPETIEHVKQLMIRSEFKRKQSPIGPKITTRSLGSKDWRYPIV